MLGYKFQEYNLFSYFDSKYALVKLHRFAQFEKVCIFLFENVYKPNYLLDIWGQV